MVKECTLLSAINGAGRGALPRMLPEELKRHLDLSCPSADALPGLVASTPAYAHRRTGCLWFGEPLKFLCPNWTASARGTMAIFL